MKQDAEEETRGGACRMEYVVVVVMIVAALLLAAYFFGRDILNSFGVAGQATSGRHESDAVQLECSGSAQGCCEKASAAVESSAKFSSEGSVQSAEVDVPLPADQDGRGRARNAAGN